MPVSDFINLFNNNNRSVDSNMSTTKKVSFDDLGDFIEERDRLRRRLDQLSKTKLKVDYSTFHKHTFFNSALAKFDVARDRILTQYPFDGNLEEKDAFFLSGTGYENYVYEQWVRYVGYASLNGSSEQYISASDSDNKLLLGSASLYVSAWIQPKISTQNVILQVMSASTAPTLTKQGYELYLSGATDPHIKFSMYSGSTIVSVSAAYNAYTASFNNIAAIYDNAAHILSLYVNRNKVSSGSATLGSIEFTPGKLYVGSGSLYSASYSNYDFYSGSIDEVRIYHTASELFHQKNFSRPVDAESFLKLNYKFNEGVVGTSSIDAGVVDYSKSALHGVILNYASTARVSGAVMLSDPGDPILYSYHSGVVAFTASVSQTASIFDRENRNNIFRLIPEDLLKSDAQAEGLLESFALSMARYFDEIKLYVDQFENLKTTNYDDVDETPDLMLPMLKRYFGWKVTDHFGDAAPLEFYYGENILTPVSGNLTTSLQDIRNQFWKRTLNNLPYLLKTKGKRNNLDAFFNVLGINKNLLSVKEFGYVEGTSIENTRLNKEKVVFMAGIGTGSLGSVSSSYFKVPMFITGASSIYTVEAMILPPYLSAAYSGSVLTGSIWQLVDPNQVTGSISLMWNVNAIGSPSGTFLLTGSDGQSLRTSTVSIFDGRMIHVAAGLKNDQKPFIEVRTLDNDTISGSSYPGSTVFSGVFTGSKYDLIIGANSGTYFAKQTQGHFGEVRFWTMALSSSELDAHAYHHESIGLENPLTDNRRLKGHWSLGENKVSDSNGDILRVTDLSRNGMYATGTAFPATTNPYKPFLKSYNYISPTIDLKWTDNKVRVRNKTKLTLADVAKDTNEVSIEFNLIDALNEDISKIFSTIDIMNNVVGNPINKYRDEYVDLESYRRVYFERLTDSLNFTTFFKLFKWFDKKLSDSIRQLLPARTKFIGGEQVVESHFLERNKYGYKYPIFRTPKDIPEAVISASANTAGVFQTIIEAALPMMGTSNASIFDDARRLFAQSVTSSYINPTARSVSITASISQPMISIYSDGTERHYRNAMPTDPPHIFGNPEDIRLTVSKSFIAHDLSFNASGNLLMVGCSASSAENHGTWLIYHSTSAAGWTVVDQELSGGAVDSPSRAMFVFTNPRDSKVYVGGAGALGGFGGRDWVVKSSSLGGATGSWAVVDASPTIGGNFFSLATAMNVDSSGNMFVCGVSSTGTTDWAWLTRRSYLSGVTGSWNTVDRYNVIGTASPPGTATELPNFVLIDRNDTVFVGGQAAGTASMISIEGPTEPFFGIIRSSSAHGDSGSWGVALQIPYAEFWDATRDAKNNLYVCGNIKEIGTVLRSQDDGKTWETVISRDHIINYFNITSSFNGPSEYLIVGGRPRSDTGLGFSAYNILDFSNNVDLGFVSGNYSFATAATLNGNSIYTAGITKFSSSANATSEYWASLSSATGSLCKISKPLDTEIRPNFAPQKVSGDTSTDVNNPTNSINLKNSWAKDVLVKRDRDNR